MEFEKLGSFYLGKEYDLETQGLTDRLVMYDARDLTTHGVCVGMTGSGKTGLCIDLLEEAAIDRVPAIIIDPKGDITNLLLQFPDLLPSDFQPWVNVDDARRKGMSLDEFSSSQAELWKKGLATWGQDGDRIRSLQAAAEFAIYTPGSDSGIPVSLLHSFKAPKVDWASNAEMLREKIQGTVTALLGLIGIEADPLRSREHILMSSLFEHSWQQGEDLDMRKLILAIQNPPIRQLGVFDVETFYPSKERFELVMSLNGIMASPSFAAWLQGEPMDVASFLATPEGKTKHSIFYLAHLNDAERMFFVTLLLNQVISWMRAQAGTTSLRALVYMDEIYGFLPPVANPPSKKPFLTLLKQARAFGVGLLLATQNPMDLDYKGLTNAGTWFIGRLQTERDKARLLEGLESASAQSGQQMDRATLDRLISSVGNRVFLLHNVHEEAPIVFQTRWAMSYLRGPLTRMQIQTLKEPKVGAPATAGPAPSTVGAVASAAAPPAAAPGVWPPPAKETVTGGLMSTPPAVPPGFNQVFLPVRKGASSALLELESGNLGVLKDPQQKLAYRPVVFASARVHFIDRKREVDETRAFNLLSEVPDRMSGIRWEDARSMDSEQSRLSPRPELDAVFEPLPEAVNEESELKNIQKDLADYLYRTSHLTLFYNAALKEYGLPNEDERDFKLRLMQLAREVRDDEVDKLTDKYDRQLRRLKTDLDKAQLAVEKKEATAQARNREFMVSVGESLVGMFMGRRSLRTASSSLGKYRMQSSAKMGVEEAEQKVEALQGELAAVEEELKTKVQEITDKWDAAVDSFETVPVTPRRSDVEVDAVALAWLPCWIIRGVDTRGLTIERSVEAI